MAHLLTGEATVKVQSTQFEIWRCSFGDGTTVIVSFCFFSYREYKYLVAQSMVHLSYVEY